MGRDLIKDMWEAREALRKPGWLEREAELTDHEVKQCGGVSHPQTDPETERNPSQNSRVLFSRGWPADSMTHEGKFKEPGIAEATLKRGTKLKAFHYSTSRLATKLSEAVWCWHKDRYTAQWGRIKRSEIDPDTWSTDFWHRCRGTALEEVIFQQAVLEQRNFSPHHVPYKS